MLTVNRNTGDFSIFIYLKYLFESTCPHMHVVVGGAGKDRGRRKESSRFPTEWGASCGAPPNDPETTN